MKTKNGWPRRVTVDNATVTVYKRITGSGSVGFMVAYRDTGGKRKFDSYTDESEALQQAETKARTLSTFGARVADIKPDEIANLVGVRDMLSPFGVDFRLCASALVRWLGKYQSLDNIETALTTPRAGTNGGDLVPINLADAVANYLKKMEGNGNGDGASEAHQSDLKDRLAWLTEDMKCQVHSVTDKILQLWFDRQKFSKANHMHFRRVFNTFFEYCVLRGHTLQNPVAGVETFTIERARVQIYTPEQIRKMLDAADAEFLPCLLFGAFGGLRPSEIYDERSDTARLNWTEVDFKTNYIVIEDQNKTGERLVPLLPNLRAWLEKIPKKTGAVIHRTKKLFNLRAAMCKKAGVPWIQDGLRHSWISYRLAELGDIGRVAGEAGNSPKIIKKHYKAIRTLDKRLVTPDLAKEWFSIMPPNPLVSA